MHLRRHGEQEAAESPVDVIYTGLRPGEKLHEVLFGDGEVDRRPVHPLISHVDVPPLDAAATSVLSPRTSDEVLLRRLQNVVAAPAFSGIDLVALAGTSRPETPPVSHVESSVLVWSQNDSATATTEHTAGGGRSRPT